MSWPGRKSSRLAISCPGATGNGKSYIFLSGSDPTSSFRPLSLIDGKDVEAYKHLSKGVIVMVNLWRLEKERGHNIGFTQTKSVMLTEKVPLEYGPAIFDIATHGVCLKN